jgi:hypothetical protein
MESGLILRGTKKIFGMYIMERSQRRQAEAIQDAFIILRKRQFLQKRLRNIMRSKRTPEGVAEAQRIHRELEVSHVPMYTLRLIFKIFEIHRQLKNLKSFQDQRKGFKFFKTKEDRLLDAAVKHRMNQLDSL